ncbi:MAG: amidohydrolase [Deltaproteobacteria bacterium]|nr:amidohydrolase [Deltaproteobacteria bacterium]
MVIDIFAHLISNRIIDLFEEKGGIKFTIPPQNADPETRLELMDKYGVDIQALSQTTPVLTGLSPEDAAEICKLSNEDNYAFCKAYPKRFVNICIISLLDMESALTELDRSVNELDCRGITVSSNQNGKGLDSPEYFPFYEKVTEHELPVLIHPANWESYPLVDMEKGWRMMQIFGWPFDTTQAVWRLIFGGVLDHFPSLKIVMHHLGAMFPFFAGRIETGFKVLQDKLPRDISEYWSNIYGDTAVNGTHAAMPCGYAFFGPDRMLYGSDYPFGFEEGVSFIRDNLSGVKAMDIPEKDMKKILSKNAKKLLKI